MSQPLISILIPCFNAERWIEEALRSAQEQTWRRVEIIVVDDGSTDESFAIIRRFASDRCRIVRQENRGASDARNQAFQISQGDFIQYLDADDFLAPDKLERHMGRMGEAPAGTLSFGSVVHFYGAEAGRDSVHKTADTCGAGDDPLEFLLRLWSGEGVIDMVQTAQWLAPHGLIEKAGLWHEGLSVDDDGEFFARVVLASSRIVAVPEARTNYRKYRHGKNLSAGGDRSAAGCWSSLQSAQLKSSHLLERCPGDRARQVVRRLITREIIKAFPHCPEVTAAGIEFLHGHGLAPGPPPEGSPWFQRLYPVIGWKAARWLQWKVASWRRRRDAIG